MIRFYDKLLLQFYECEKKVPDLQVLTMLENNTVTNIPIGIILSQFKYCIEVAKKDDRAYTLLRNYLVTITSEEFVKKLEVLKCQ